MERVPTSVVAAAGLVGGYAVARWTKVRPLGGVVLGAAADRGRAGMAPAGRPRPRRPGSARCTSPGSRARTRWRRRSGPGRAVFGAAGVVAAAAWAVADRG